MESHPVLIRPVKSEKNIQTFRVDNLPNNVIGENKSVNDIETAKTELLDYLDNTRQEYGIATDGYRWGSTRSQRQTVTTSPFIRF